MSTNRSDDDQIVIVICIIQTAVVVAGIAKRHANYDKNMNTNPSYHIEQTYLANISYILLTTCHFIRTIVTVWKGITQATLINTRTVFNALVFHIETGFTICNISE